MFLQPFVENSIWHGILPMEKPGEINIDIKRSQPNEIAFIIEDNGIGIDNSLAQKNEHSHMPPREWSSLPEDWKYLRKLRAKPSK